jgi:hypothetical protein
MQVVKIIRTILRRVFKSNSKSDWSKKQIEKMARLGGRLVL